MTSSDLSVLLDMGFEKERAELAVKKSGGCKCVWSTLVWYLKLICDMNKVQGALEWLEQNQDKSLEEINAPPDNADDPTAEPPALKPGEEARSLVCNDCGKKFRSQGQAEFHASKTQHVDFAESTEEIAPLTEEEKKAKLEELRRKLAEKRAGGSDLDKIDKKRNEVSSEPLRI